MSTPQSTGTHVKTIGYFGIFISLIVVFLLTPLFANNYHSYIGLQGAFVMLLTSVSYSISERRRSLVIGAWVAFLFITLDCLSLYMDSSLLMVLAYIVMEMFLFFAIVLLLRGIFLAPYIDNNLIFGTLASYLLIGIFWGKLYFLDLLLYPGSFHGLGHVIHETSNLGGNFDIQFDLLYYSFTTLATLGMGDITPIHHLSKSLTVVEAVFGQLFVAIVIAKIVSVWKRIE